MGNVISSYYLKSYLTTPTPKDLDIDKEKQAPALFQATVTFQLN